MLKDLLIFHLTDLHFPTNGEMPFWTDRFLRVVKNYASKSHCEIYAFAITGDLVVSPTPQAYATVNDFIKKILEAAGLKSNGQLATNRMWIVGGNHDYKKYGAFWKTKTTISDSKLKLLKNPFKDSSKNLHVFGLHSGKVEAGARGRIEIKDLEIIENEVEKSDSKIKHFKDFRIALLHHHLIPLPDKPKEWRKSKFEEVQSLIEDEAFMLLENAGLTTAVLIDHGFHLVLHGHRHKQFVSRVRHCAKTHGWKQPLTIIGGKAASEGFNLIKFTKSGNTDLVTYQMEKEKINYDDQPPIQLWSYDEWKAWSWEYQKQIYGFYKKARCRKSITTIGDSIETIEIRQILGSNNDPIRKINFKCSAIPKNRAAVQIGKLYDLHNDREIDITGAEIPGPEANFDFILNPAATSEETHKGYDIVIIGRNTFSITKHDAALRPKGEKNFGVDDKHELYSFHFKYPVENFELWLRFPSGFEPKKVKIECEYLDHKGKPVGVDMPETSRAKSCLKYDPEFGVICLMMKRITPNNVYSISWELPELELEKVNQDKAEMNEAELYFDELINDTPRDQNSWINKLLSQLKSDLLLTNIKDSFPQREALHVSLFVLSPKSRKLIPAGGTFKHHSDYWNFELPWGMGVRGLALRRGKAEFYVSKPNRIPVIYIAPKNCPRDKFLLAVPIVIPPGYRFPKSEHSPGFFKAVICVGSPSETSGLRFLEKIDTLKQICDIIKKMGQNMWKQSPLT